MLPHINAVETILTFILFTPNDSHRRFSWLKFYQRVLLKLNRISRMKSLAFLLGAMPESNFCSREAAATGCQIEIPERTSMPLSSSHR